MRAVTVVIPSRLGSKRFPGKALIDVRGKPMLQRCCESVQNCGYEPVIVTPDTEIEDLGKRIGIRTIMSQGECRNGTERSAQAARLMGLEPDSILVNCQGDMFNWKDPGFLTNPIEMAKRFFCRGLEIMVTVYCTSFPVSCLASEDTVKVIRPMNVNSEKHVWFTRSTKPNIIHALLGIHFGLYVSTVEQFFQYAMLPQTYQERTEGLEQLRWKIPIEAVAIHNVRPLKIDSESDLSAIDNVPVLEERYC